ncbi:hypothetical protein QYM36_011160, partial [Artemia franciscana]
KNYTVKFGQVYVGKPIHWEKDSTPTKLMPNEARLRNLTYSSPLYVDIVETITRGGKDLVVHEYQKTFI